MKKKALITGVTGQDGSYLCENLLSKGYEVHGIIRRSSSFNTKRINHIIHNDEFKEKFFFHYGDLTDASNLNRLLEKIEPNEIYNLAAQSHVKVSFEIPDYTAQVDALGTLRFLDAIRETQIPTKFYQASTSELYGKVQETPQSESTPFYPRSPYGVAKLYAYWIIVNYREAYNIFASNGILFNHESPRRGETFVTRKITRAVSKIFKGKQKLLLLGNLDAKRDWGYAPEYVEGMHKMMIQKTPDDYVLATGQTHSIKEFVDETFKQLNIPIKWNINKYNFKVKRLDNNKIILKSNNYYKRNIEVDWLKGDYKKAMIKLNWKPKVKFKQLIKLMLEKEILNFKN